MRTRLRRGRPAPAGLLLCCLACLAGCNNNPDVTGASVAGTVRCKGQPVAGGTICFVAAADANKSTTGKIDGGGQFRVENVPVGECRIAIETESAKVDPQAMVALARAKGAADAPSVPAGKPLKYVPIDKKYSDPAKTPLKATIERGVNQKDFDVD